MTPPVFTASRNGFAFINSWPSEPAVSITTPFGPINIGNAEAGLCGGMVYAAMDYWYAGGSCPTSQPAPASPLYKFLVHRIIDSWNVPVGVTQYYTWMSLPDADSTFDFFGHQVPAERGVSSRTVTQQWPQVKHDIDTGIPSPLGIVTVKSSAVGDLGHNHQVLACAYSTDNSVVTLDVYDPNRGQRDDVSIRFDTANPQHGTTFTHNLGISEPVRGFFRSRYSPTPVPPSAA